MLACMESPLSMMRRSPQPGEKRDRAGERETEQEDEQAVRDLSRRKTLNLEDAHHDHRIEGRNSEIWLHSCPMDEDEESQKDAQEEPDMLEDISLNYDEALTTQMTEEIATQTPELCACAIGTEARVSAPPAGALPLFSLFRPKAQRKVLVVIRHGESEHNAAQTKAQGWADPKLIDPSLTAKGCQQARQLRQHLSHEMQHNKYITGKDASALWVTSPLRRCLQTFLLSCPLLPATASDNSSCSSGQKAVGQQVEEKLSALHCQGLPPVRVVSHIAERVLTHGDIGTASSQLKTEFAPLQHCFEFDDELWWHGGFCNNQENGQSVPERESSKNLKARITAAKLWLEQQSEQIVFLYGHSVFWKAFFAQEESLRNCEYRVVHW